jgi:tetratricopeptide (TPR) repeat protein
VRQAFVGRDRERAELLAGLRDAVAGRGRLVLIAGGPGIGKTELADHIAGHAHDLGVRVLWGRCWEGGGAPPYLPWAQIIAALADGCDDDALRSYAGLGASRLAGLVPELAERLGTVASEVPSPASATARFQLFEATAKLLRNAAAVRPLMVILDDLHAADAPSLLLLRFLARDVPASPLMVLGTYRNVKAGSSPDAVDMLGDIAREGDLLVLGGLDHAEVTNLIADLSEFMPRDDTMSAIFDATAGNPLFVREVIRLMAAQDALEHPGGPDVPIPDTVRAVIRRRLASLSRDAVEVVSAAAVVGRDFDLSLIAPVCGLPNGQVLNALSDAVASDVVAEVPGMISRYSFTHPLLREVIYEQLPIPARMQLHLRIGETIEARSGSDAGAHLAELAHHFAAGADPGTAPKALDYARRAGDRAMATLAYEEAAAEFRRALRVLELAGGDERIRGELHLSLGDALARAGDYREAKDVYLRAAEMARTLASPERLARAALGFGEPRVEGGLVDRRLIALLREALDRLAPDDDPLRARLLARLSLELTFSDDPALRESLSRDAVEMARRLEDTSVLGTALRARWAAVWAPDRLDERSAVSDEIVRLARDTDDVEHELRSLALRASAAMERGQFHTAEIDIATHARLADELRMPIHQSASATMRAMQALMRGALDESERFADRALSLQAARTTTQVTHLHSTALIRWEQGRLRETREAWRRLVDTFPHVPLAHAWLSLALAEDDRHEEARAGLRSVVGGISRGPRDGLWLPALAVASLVTARLDDTHAADALYPALLPYAERVIVFAAPEPVMSLGSASFSLALLATARSRWDDAERHFEAALRVHERAGATALLVNVRFDYARMLIRRDRSGDHGRAAELLDQALPTARATGMARVSHEGEQLRDISDGTVVARPRAGAAASTTAGDSVFRREGDYWTIAYDGSLIRLRDSKGLRYLARLLTAPGQELHSVDLEVAESQTGRQPSASATADAHHAQLEVRRDLGDAGELLDAKAKAAYKARLDELQGEIDEAERFNDPARAAKARQEKDFLVAELARAVGLGGRDRKAASHAERARLNVTRAIRAALANLGRANPSLGQHLSSTIRTGRYCSYTPDPRAPITWEL